jgi:hypothetical protein
MDDPIDLDAIRARARVHVALDALEIYGSVRDEMVADPTRALAILDRVMHSVGVHNRAAFAISSWRRATAVPDDPPPALRARRWTLSAGAQPELEVEPPELEALEYVWAQPASDVGNLILRLIATALARHGGFEAMRASFDRHRT